MRPPDRNEYTGHHAGDIVKGRSPYASMVRALIVLLLLGMMAWPFVEPYLLEVEAVTLYSTDLPTGLKSLRVVYLSDIHAGKFFGPGRVSNLISRINAMEADLVLLGGDYAEDSDSAVAFFQALPRIHARYGVFAVPGNHDRTLPESNLNALRTAMQEAGVTPLINTAVPVRLGTQSIWIAGVDDMSCGHPDLNAVTKMVHAEDYVIFLCHNPSIINHALDARDANQQRRWFDLGLFGHTHGGQVAFTSGIVRDENVPEEYRSGWKRVNRIDLLTSRGVGTSLLPIRIFCRPQIHLITIRPQTSGS